MKTKLEVITFECNDEGLNLRKGSEFHTFESNGAMRDYCRANGMVPKIHKYWIGDHQRSLRGIYKAEIERISNK